MEALERRASLVAIVAFLCVCLSQCRGVEGQRDTTQASYVCPPNFIRLGHACYFFSEAKASWHKALFACLDRESNLTVPARWEDRNLRNYLVELKTSNASRWIGGMYDYNSKSWLWGGDLRNMNYQSFSKMKEMTPEELQWHCIAMVPEKHYRWSAELCIEQHQYICKTKLKKVPKDKVKEYRRRWQRMGKMNEITAPIVSREVNEPMLNDVTVNPRPYELRNRSRAYGRRHGSARNNRTRYNSRLNAQKRRLPKVQRRLKRPFPGYSWDRRNPAASYKHNAMVLLSGRTGLTPQQVKTNLARLKHLRDRQIARQKRLRDKDDWLENKPQQALAQTHPRTYTINSNYSALHPKTIVEEFDMFMPPPQPIVLPRPTRNAV